MRRRVVLTSLGVLCLLPGLAPAVGVVSVTFMGFQTFPDQTSRIFVHMARKPAIDVSKEKLRVVFTLRGAHIASRNNKNPLNLEHFATPAKRARLLAVGDDVQFVVELKREVETRHRFLDNTDRSVSLQLDFPAPRER